MAKVDRLQPTPALLAAWVPACKQAGLSVRFPHSPSPARPVGSPGRGMFFVFAILAMIVTSVLLLLVLFEPGLEYHITPPRHAMDSPEYLQRLGALVDAEQHHVSRLEVLTNGSDFYEAELAAIAAAKNSINLEAYIFQKDKIGHRFVDALTERAKAGVKVNVVIDAIGSFATSDKMFADLRAAGGRVKWYQPIRWHTLKRFNNRTHRELLIIDGEVGFIGGAGIG